VIISMDYSLLEYFYFQESKQLFIFLNLDIYN